MLKKNPLNALSRSQLFILLSCWFVLSAMLLLSSQTPKQIDFERYMSISKYIYFHKQYLLMHFNGAVYTDKPPFMFWLTAAGWKLLGGVHIWWPYFMLCLFSGGSVFLTYHIAKILYEGDGLAPSINKAFKSALFLLTLTFFGMASCEFRVDTFLLFYALLIQYGCLKLSSPRLRTKQYYLSCGTIFLGVALGLFTKGPLILVDGLLPALIGLWASKRKMHFKPILLSVILGLIPILFWLIPACIAGGPAYTQDVLFGQIANRSTRSTESIFFYLIRLPGYLFPFSIFPRVWKKLYQACAFWNKVTLESLHSAVRYSLSGILVLAVIFSLFGQKAMHYLLPTMPLWAIFLANVVEFKSEEKYFFKIFLIVFAGFSLFLLIWQTGKGLQLLQLTSHYTYNLYLMTQSFQLWQLILLAFFSVGCLIWLHYKRMTEKSLLFLLVLFSLIIQINIQIFNVHYYQKRFYIYFEDTVTAIQQAGKKIYTQLSEKDNKPQCSTFVPTEIARHKENVSNLKNADYMVSNQRCLFFNARYWGAQPVAIYAPQIYCSFGLWKMNDQTKMLIKACEEKK